MNVARCCSVSSTRCCCSVCASSRRAEAVLDSAERSASSSSGNRPAASSWRASAWASRMPARPQVRPALWFSCVMNPARGPVRLFGLKLGEPRLKPLSRLLEVLALGLEPADFRGDRKRSLCATCTASDAAKCPSRASSTTSLELSQHGSAIGLDWRVA
ncbi:MAG: hypothetical protein R3E33_02910 [Rhodocyclaceae bacterium]